MVAPTFFMDTSQKLTTFFDSHNRRYGSTGGYDLRGDISKAQATFQIGLYPESTKGDHGNSGQCAHGLQQIQKTHIGTLLVKELAIANYL